MERAFGETVNNIGNDQFKDLSHPIIDKLKQDIIGDDYVFQGPFGPRNCKFLIWSQLVCKQLHVLNLKECKTKSILTNAF